MPTDSYELNRHRSCVMSKRRDGSTELRDAHTGDVFEVIPPVTKDVDEAFVLWLLFALVAFGGIIVGAVIGHAI